MTELEPILQRLGLHQYYSAFVAEGFETWETLLDIQESDLEVLNVRLGHRRKLQRAIAEFRGISSDRPLGTSSHEAAAYDVKSEPGLLHTGNSKEANPSGATDQKRKYRRHPKPDEHAPEKPPSAYVLFSNKVREEVKTENLSFTEIARLVGERWQKLEPAQKELFESHAAALKDTYNAQLSEYKKTDAYKEYAQYLADFKAKHENHADTKRPKLEQHASSSVSANSGGDPIEAAPQAATHARADSVGSPGTASLFGSTSTLHLVTSLQNLNAPVGRRGSPPIQMPSDRYFAGPLASGPSSLSEESSSTRYDQLDALSRAATLTADTPSVSTPPPSAMSSRGQRSEHNLAYLAQQLPQRPPTYSYQTSAASGTSPESTVSSLQSNVHGPEHWREKSSTSAEARSFYTGTSQPASSSMLISQLVGQEPAAASSQRTLPPLRQLTGAPTNMPFTGLGSSSTSSPVSLFHPPSDSMVLRQGGARDTSRRSETEAADTLAALADRRPSFGGSKTMRNPLDQTRRR